MKFYYFSLLTLLINAQDTTTSVDVTGSADSNTYDSVFTTSVAYTSIKPSPSHYNRFNGNDAYICLPINKKSYDDLLNFLPKDIQPQISSIIVAYQSNLSSATDSDDEVPVPTDYDDYGDDSSSLATDYDVTSDSGSLATDSSVALATDSSITSTSDSSVVSPTDSSNLYTSDFSDSPTNI